MGNISKHFSYRELQCKCCSKLQIDYKLIEMMERLRDRFNCPIVVTSCYRCQNYNMELVQTAGASPHSLHQLGWAVDFYFKGYSVKDMEEKMMEMHQVSDILIGGLGVYYDKNFFHCDIGAKRYWDDKK